MHEVWQVWHSEMPEEGVTVLRKEDASSPQEAILKANEEWGYDEEEGFDRAQLNMSRLSFDELIEANDEDFAAAFKEA